MKTKTLGIIGGLGELAGADLFGKLVKAHAMQADRALCHFLCEQHPYRDAGVALTHGMRMTSRKLYVFQTSQAFAERQADAILLPCFASHVFRDEIQSELDIPVLDMMDALRRHVGKTLAPGGRLGVLTSDFTREAKLFERYFGEQYRLVYPSPQQQLRLMDAVYGPHGLQAGHVGSGVLDRVEQPCRELLEQQVDLLLPGFTELALVSAFLALRGIELPDINEIYAAFALAGSGPIKPPPFKLGIVGGVGPVATVDFMGKVIRNTPAGCDQDHIKMVVEQNPQIPDRTAHLLRGGTDPSVALLATCQRLEAEGAQAIAIPCNTAHAFVGEIQPYLSVPIVNMLSATVTHIQQRFGRTQTVGLLATAGTVASRVYHAIAERAGLRLIVPEPAYQAKVMNVIYGEFGVKAGYTDGRCKAELLEVAAHLADAGAGILILGCTELPLLLQQTEHYEIGGRSVALIDPTEVLAQRCVQLAKPPAPASTPATVTLR